MSPHACPDRQQYEQLIVGVYPPDDELARLAEHLEGCSRCADAVGSLPGSDTFVALVAAGTPLPHAEDHVVRRIEDQLIRHSLPPCGVQLADEASAADAAHLL